MEESLGALARVDGEIRPGRVADEQRVAGEHEPLGDDESAVLGPMARGVQHTHRYRTGTEDLFVLERLVGERRVGDGMDRHRNAVLECEAAVARHVVGVRVGLEHADDAHAVGLCRLEVLLDRVRGVDDERLAGGGIPDQIRGAARILSRPDAVVAAVVSGCPLQEVRRWRCSSGSPRAA